MKTIVFGDGLYNLEKCLAILKIMHYNNIPCVKLEYGDKYFYLHTKNREEQDQLFLIIAGIMQRE